MTERVPLLLHSLADLRELWLPLLELAEVRSVTEIGAGTGAVTRLLVRSVGERGGGRVVTVDPTAPEPPPQDQREDVDLEIVRELSPGALEGRPGTDCYIVDGDHNHHVVSAELGAVERAGPDHALPLVLLNDVAWPCARRDQYYDPAVIPPDSRHPFTYDGGVRPGLAGVDRDGGFRGDGDFAVARTEGGPANGVLTAVEDFIATRPHLHLHVVTAVCGLGVLVDDRAPWAAAVTAAIAPFADNGFVERMEANRVELFLRVLDLQRMVEDSDRERLRVHARLAALCADRRSAALDQAVSELTDDATAPLP